MAYANRILSALDTRTLAQLEPHFVRQSVRPRQVLVEQGAKYDCVYFVESGLLACSAMFENGDALGVGYIGPEGAAGVTAALSEHPASHQVITRTSATLLKVEVGHFRKIVNDSPPFRRLLDAYVDTLVTSTQLDLVCFALHPLEARISAGLATASDATGLDAVEGTHEQLASLLGVQRSSVTTAARAMEAGGLIQVARGSMQITDRTRVEKSACGCYRRRADLWSDFWDK